MELYKKNLDTMFRRFREALPKTCLVIWNMTLPISKKARGGVLIPEVEHLNVSLRLDILEANFYVHKVTSRFFLAYFIANIGSHSQLKIVSFFPNYRENSQLKVTK